MQLKLTKKEPEKFQIHSTSSKKSTSRRIVRLQHQMIGKASPAQRNIEFENEISRWSTSSIPDDCELPPAPRTEIDFHQKFVEASDTVPRTTEIFEKPSEMTDQQPVIHSKTGPIHAQTLSPFTSARKMVIRTVAARLCKPARSLLLQFSSTDHKSEELPAPECINHGGVAEQIRPPSKPLGLWGYRAHHLQRIALDPEAEEIFCNKNWRNRIHTAALFVQCSFRMHIARKSFTLRKATACPKIREKSRGLLTQQLRNAFLNKRFSHQVPEYSITILSRK